jgi:putative transposase
MNKYNPNIHHRRTIRLKGYDYSQTGLYFITICTKNRGCLFGEIRNGKMVLNDAGDIANKCWYQITNHFPNTILHEHIIMPNHVHGIIEITVGANNHSPENHSPENHSPENHSPENHSPENHWPENHWPENHCPKRPAKIIAKTGRKSFAKTGRKYFPKRPGEKYFAPTGIPIKNNRINCSRI